jgi:hypothetical protein
MRHASAFLLFLCLPLELLLASPQTHYTVKTELWEVLYHGDDPGMTERIVTLDPVKVADSSPNGFEQLAGSIAKSIQTYTAKSRPTFSASLDDFTNKSGPIKKVILYEVQAQGVKGSGLRNVGSFDLTATLDKAKVYALLPILAGYDCDLVNLAYSRGGWVLQSSHGTQELTASSCQARKFDNWIVEVKVTSEAAAKGEEIKRELYDAIDALGQARYKQLESFRQEEGTVAERNSHIPPGAQVALSQAQSNFLLKASVK